MPQTNFMSADWKGMMQGRNYLAPTVQKFLGISLYDSLATVGPDSALDCLNVIPGMDGALHKFRYPSRITTVFGASIQSFYDFQQANGTRQILAVSGNSPLYWNAFTPLVPPTVIETNVIDAGTWNFVTSNNIAFGCNGQTMIKWTGTVWQVWGIQKPGAGTAGVVGTITQISRNANQAQINGSAWPAVLGTAPFGGAGDLLRVSGVSDATFNTQVAQISNGLYANVGANVAPFAPGANAQALVYASLLTNSISNIARTNGVSTITLGALSLLISYAYIGMRIEVSGLASATFNGTFTISAINVGANKISYLQGLADVASAGDVGTIKAGNDDAGTLSWRYAYGNSVTGHVGAASDILTLPAGAYQANRQYYLQAAVPNPADTQADQIYWFRTISGGADFYLHSIATIAIQGYYLADNKNDLELNTAVKAPLLNFPAPVGGKYLSKFQGRIFISGFPTAPQDIVYTAYEQVLLGRPEESFFPFNRLRLQIGADDVRGHGVIQAGVVAFSRSNQMYMFRGVVEDVTTSSPVNFSAFLEELPWKVGCISHYTIQSCPYGLIWWASDKNVKVYSGTDEPINISTNVLPLLRDATPGTEIDARGYYFEWLDRKWYALLLAVNGSLTKNRIIFFDLEPNAEKNVGAFPCSFPADDIQVLEDPATGGRKLCISQNGAILDLLLNFDTTNGITLVPAPTQLDGNGKPQQVTAYWNSGYWGSDDPSLRKQFRLAGIEVDNNGYKIQARVVDDNNPMSAPLMLDITDRFKNEKYAIDRKGYRCGINIVFPSDDISASVLEMGISYIPTSTR